MKRVGMSVAVILAVWWQPALVMAATSSHFKINESLLGGSGALNSTSPNFRASSSVGAAAFTTTTTSNHGSSTNFQGQGGYVTTSDPALAFNVGASSINFGTLSQASTASATSTFSVIDYTSYGYVVQTVGPPPNSGAHVLAAMSSPALAQTGVEQFGINLVANTLPRSFGAAPTGGSGVAASGYNTTNLFKYANGGTIASSPKSSGQTNFTISYIADDSVNTPGGTYAGAITLVCTGTY